MVECRPDSRPSRTATCTSVTPRRSRSTSSSPRSSVASAICASTTRTRTPRTPAFVDGIVDDMAWLGYPTDGRRCSPATTSSSCTSGRNCSSREGLAYVDEQDGETISAQRGGYGKPGIESRSATARSSENLDLLRRMRAGEFADGSHVLRAKIDMQHENMQLRDPVMYRIRHGHHHRTGDALGHLPDLRLGARAERRHRGRHALAVHAGVRQPPAALRLVSRAVPAAVRAAPPDRVRPARADPHGHLEAQAAKLVRDGMVDGWDDPRMPTLRGLRRRGYPAERSARSATSSASQDEQPPRDRTAGVVRPHRAQPHRAAPHGRAAPARSRHHQLAGRRRRRAVVEHVEVVNNPENDAAGTRQVPFSGELSSSGTTSWPSRRRSTSA